MFVSTVTDQSRKFVFGCVETYRYGHNGQEKEDEIAGAGNVMSAEYWMYDSRLLRRWERDPITYPWQSSYTCFNNNPVYYSDPLGLEGNDKGKGVWNDKTRKYDYTKTGNDYGPNVMYITFEGGEYDGQILVYGKTTGAKWFGRKVQQENKDENTLEVLLAYTKNTKDVAEAGFSVAKASGQNYYLGRKVAGGYGVKTTYEGSLLSGKAKWGKAPRNPSTGNYTSDLDLSVEGSVVNGSFGLEVGSDKNNIAGTAKGSVLSAKAGVNVGLVSGGDGSFGFVIGGDANAAVLSGEVGGSVTVLGVKTSGSIAGQFIAVGGGVMGSILYNPNTGVLTLTGIEHLAIFFGERLAISVELPIGIIVPSSNSSSKKASVIKTIKN